jgi:uncharacterized protein with GYD domain
VLSSSLELAVADWGNQRTTSRNTFWKSVAESQEDTSMPTYVTLLRFTDQSIRSIKDSPARIESSKKDATEAGGSVKAVYLTLGRYDLISITEWPSDEMAAAAALALASKGNVTTETMRAFTPDEFKQILEKVPST